MLAQIGRGGRGARLAEGGLEAGVRGVVGPGEVDDGGVAAGDELGVAADPLAHEEEAPQSAGQGGGRRVGPQLGDVVDAVGGDRGDDAGAGDGVILGLGAGEAADEGLGGAVGKLGGDGGVGAALDLFGGLGVEPGGAVELAGHGDSSRGAGAPATTRSPIVSRERGHSPVGSLPADGEAGSTRRSVVRLCWPLPMASGLCFRPSARPLSSVGQSCGLLIRRSWVRAPQGVLRRPRPHQGPGPSLRPGRRSGTSLLPCRHMVSDCVMVAGIQ